MTPLLLAAALTLSLTCAPGNPKAVQGFLKAHHGEVSVAHRVSPSQHVVDTFYASPRGTWTILRWSRYRVVCIIGAGQSAKLAATLGRRT